MNTTGLGDEIMKQMMSWIHFAEESDRTVIMYDVCISA